MREPDGYDLPTLVEVRQVLRDAVLGLGLLQPSPLPPALGVAKTMQPVFVEELGPPGANPDEDLVFEDADPLDQAYLRHQIARYRWHDQKRSRAGSRYRWTVGRSLPPGRAVGDRLGPFMEGRLEGIVHLFEVPLLDRRRRRAFLGLQTQAFGKRGREVHAWVSDARHCLVRKGERWQPSSSSES